MNVLVDTNILLDVLAKRKPFYEASASIWSLAECGDLTAFVSVISYNNIYYIVRKAAGREEAAEAMKIMRDVFRTVAAGDQIINQCIDSEIDDFEDAIQYFSGFHAHAQHLITRNPQHFPASGLSILTPDEFLAIWHEQSEDHPPGEDST
jgi:predicted nucleic acid-binding protein